MKGATLIEGFDGTSGCCGLDGPIEGRDEPWIREMVAKGI